MKKSGDFWKTVLLVIMAVSFIAIGCRQIDLMEETQEELENVKEIITEYNQSKDNFNEQWEEYFGG